jgi:hypothetical protein
MARRTLVKLLPLAVFMLAAGCNPAPEVSPAEQEKREPVAAGSDVLRFTLEESGQSLELRNVSDGGFDAAISVAGACSRTEAGFARAVTSEGDVDVEVDPDGEGHPTDTFALPPRNECQVTILLAAPGHDYAWLREADCATDCPLSGNPMTRR